MTRSLHRWLAAGLRASGLQYFPVRARGGLNRGALWTLFPWSAYWRGNFEPELTRTILALDDLAGQCCWDIGAHFGYYSVGLALRVGPCGRVAAFEPFPSSFSRLARHAGMNRLNWLTPVQAAASDVDGMADLVVTAGESDTTVHLPYDGEYPGKSTPRQRVRTVKLDTLVADQSIALPDLIKIDVEGHGHRVLAGARESLQQTFPKILISLHSPHEIEGTLSILTPLGYRWRPLGDEPGESIWGGDYLFTAG